MTVSGIWIISIMHYQDCFEQPSQTVKRTFMQTNKQIKNKENEYMSRSKTTVTFKTNLMDPLVLPMLRVERPLLERP